MNSATVTAPAWTTDDRELDVDALAEGLHVIYDAPIAGHWITPRGHVQGEVEP